MLNDEQRISNIEVLPKAAIKRILRAKVHKVRIGKLKTEMLLLHL